jgi:cyclase
MNFSAGTKSFTRRELLQKTTPILGGTALAQLFPGTFTARIFAGRAGAAAYPRQDAAPVDRLPAFRAQLGALPIETVKLGENLTMLSGPGGNVVILSGPDGKISVDGFVQPAWPRLKHIIDGMGNAPLKLVIDTHWHWDHTDNNSAFHEAGAAILAHENTKKRLREAHEFMGMRFRPAPADALPTQTLKDTYRLQANGETLDLVYVLPAHTDSDIYVRYQKADVLHCGDLFFNGAYPFIDAQTGGSIHGMIAGAEKVLQVSGRNTKVVPGHGPLGDKTALTKYRDVLVIARERVQKLKSSGKKLEEVVAAKPLSEFDADWGKGFMNPQLFLTVVYNTL